MSETKTKATPLQEATMILRFLREGNESVRTGFLKKLMGENGLKPEDLGTTAEELRELDVADARRQVRNNLVNWRTTYEIQPPGESCFASGIVEGLRRGKLAYAEFGITDIEMGHIKRSADLG